MKTYAFRIQPGKDLKVELKKFAEEKNIKAGIILTAVGCLTRATIRMAGATSRNQEVKVYNEDFEVVSLIGTMSVLAKNDSHLHIALSNKTGQVIGGHLKDGSRIGVTMEIVIGELENVEFTTELDNGSGFDLFKVIEK